MYVCVCVRVYVCVWGYSVGVWEGGWVGGWVVAGCDSESKTDLQIITWFVAGIRPNAINQNVFADNQERFGGKWEPSGTGWEKHGRGKR